MGDVVSRYCSYLHHWQQVADGRAHGPVLNQQHKDWERQHDGQLEDEGARQVEDAGLGVVAVKFPPEYGKDDDQVPYQAQDDHRAVEEDRHGQGEGPTEHWPKDRAGKIQVLVLGVIHIQQELVDRLERK